MLSCRKKKHFLYLKYLFLNLLIKGYRVVLQICLSHRCKTWAALILCWLIFKVLLFVIIWKVGQPAQISRSRYFILKELQAKNLFIFTFLAFNQYFLCWIDLFSQSNGLIPHSLFDYSEWIHKWYYLWNQGYLRFD